MTYTGCFLCGVQGQIPQAIPAGTLGFQKMMFRIECMCGAAGGWAFDVEAAWASWNKVARHGGVSVMVGAELFRFTSEAEWISKGRSWFKNCGVPGDDCLCIDAAGRICVSGKEFRRATTENTYPIIVYPALVKS